MGWKDDMYNALADFLRGQDVEVYRITGLETEYDEPYGDCDTCGYNSLGGDWSVNVMYIEREGNARSKTFEYYGKFEDLIRELT